MSVDDVAEFFDATPPPEAIEELEARMQEFINTHNANGTPIVIITSGGTRGVARPLMYRLTGAQCLWSATR